MLKIDQIRSRQEQRLLPVLDAWNEAKKRLESALALAEVREREFREVSEDVRRRLEAVDLVVSMSKELEDETSDGRRLHAAENQSVNALMLSESAGGEMKAIEAAKEPVENLSAAPELQALDSVLRKTSRPLFSSQQRSRFTSLSILQ